MPEKAKSITVNTLADNSGGDISIEKLFIKDSLGVTEAAASTLEEGNQSHRHNSHAFFLLESGSIILEIDFQKYRMSAPSVIYVHPDQVHRTSGFDNVVVSSWAITNENLNPEYLAVLEEIKPAQPLALDEETFSLISEAVSITLKFSERQTGKLHHSLLKDSCNALIALVVSHYLKTFNSTEKILRFELITKAFRKTLESSYKTVKRPAEYAQKLHISAPYLNECVKNATGYSVSYHIQQRVILEAKRLLYHSGKSVKEIALELGFDDHPYFSRLFAKITGMTASSFRKKNLD